MLDVPSPVRLAFALNHTLRRDGSLGWELGRDVPGGGGADGCASQRLSVALGPCALRTADCVPIRAVSLSLSLCVGVCRCVRVGVCV